MNKSPYNLRLEDYDFLKDHIAFLQELAMDRMDNN
jgi:hypothetical protein